MKSACVSIFSKYKVISGAVNLEYIILLFPSVDMPM